MVEWILVSCLCLILIVAVLLAWWYPSLKDFSQTSWNVFFVVLTPISLFLSVVFWFSTLQMQQRDTLHHDRDSLTTIQHHIARVEQCIIDSSSICPQFVQSLTGIKAPKLSNESDNFRSQLQAEYIANRIFDLIELYLHEKPVCDISTERFSKWFKSQELRDIWDKCRYSHSQATQEFIRTLTS